MKNLDGSNLLMYQTLVETSQDLVWCCDKQGRYTYLNPACEEIFGYSVEEMIGRNFTDFQHPDMAKRDMKMFGRLLQGEMVKRQETIHVGKAGNDIYLVVNARAVFNENGIVVGTCGTAYDITDRKKTELFLQEKVDLLAKLSAQAPGMLFKFRMGSDGDFAVQYSSEGVKNLLGCTSEEICESMDPFFKVVHPDDRETILSSINESARDLTQWVCEYRVLVPGEPIKWVYASSSPEKQDDGSVVWYGYSTDITSSKKVGVALRERTSLLSNFASQLPGVLFQFKLAPDGSFSVPYSSDGGKTIFHCTPEDIRDDFSPIFNIIHDDDKEKVLSTIDASAKSMKQWTCEYRLSIPGEPEKWIYGNSIPEKFDDGSIVWSGYNVDITELKRTEQALKEKTSMLTNLAKQVPGMFFQLKMGPDGVYTVLYSSDGINTIFGYTYEDIRDDFNRIFNVIHDDDKDKVASTFQESAENMTHWICEYRVCVPDEPEKWIYGNAIPEKFDDGSIVWSGYNVDITERKQADEAYRNSQKLESLGVLAGGIAHDFNNLFSGIYGYIDIANDLSTDSEVVKYLLKTLATIDRARYLTHQLLTFSKGGAPVKKCASLFPFVKEAALFSLSGSNITCEFQVEERLWSCEYDRSQIAQVVDSLVVNAKHAMKGGGKIVISAENVSELENLRGLRKGNYVKISFKDSGVGIPKENLTRIYDPFFSTKPNRHGLGLATSYSIVSQHEGTILVRSEPGEGSEFTIYLPAVVDVAETVVNGQVQPHSGSGIFLVMDDESVVLDMLERILTKFGYQVICARNGREALNLFTTTTAEGGRFSGIIFDLVVPGNMGGKEAVGEIRKTDKDVPVFVASGYADDPVIADPTVYGFTASICKPFRKFELADMLNKFITKV